MFRIFYSITYTTLYFLCLVILAITPVSMIWAAIQRKAYQYVFMIGGSYVLTAILAVVLYSSRLYTNRSSLAAVGKAYIPIEDGEVGKLVRKMIVKQLERSAIVAWEGKPRDLYGEILEAEKDGHLPAETRSVGHNDYTVGRIVSVDPQNPPWGDVQHDGWSSPSHCDANMYPDVRFADVVQELPNLIEARAVSLAPANEEMEPDDDNTALPDPDVLALLQRTQNMALREYMMQLSYLELFQPPDLASDFLAQYERARFFPRPMTLRDFNRLMATFSQLIAGMTAPSPAIVDAIRAKAAEHLPTDEAVNEDNRVSSKQYGVAAQKMSPAAPAPDSGQPSPGPAQEIASGSITPALPHALASQESFASVVHKPSSGTSLDWYTHHEPNMQHAPSIKSIPSDAGSVLRHSE